MSGCGCAKRRAQIAQTVKTVKDKIATGVNAVINRGTPTSQTVLNRGRNAKGN